ncbi:speedy protein 1-B-like isoform X1 [Pomacea canaliculata]|nr:speedy protein 1-B-like isoform X1 [Pomacea canaliculata]
MVFAYFKRADLSLWEYTRFNFFIALYLANDVEEDEEEIKYEIFPWALGKMWKEKYPSFLKKRDRLLRQIDYKAIVSRRCSDEIMAIEPDHPLWKRERPIHHAGASRSYMRDPEDDGYPRGPDLSPRYCHHCDSARDSQYDSASPASLSWYVSSGSSSPEEETSPRNKVLVSRAPFSGCSFDMKGLQRTLPTKEEVIPSTEE